MDVLSPLKKWEHWHLAAVMVVVQFLDVAVTGKLVGGGELDPGGARVVMLFHAGSGYLLLLLLGVILLSIMRPASRWIVTGLVAYLGFALLHLVVDVAALLLSASGKATGLASLWDVAAIGAMSVLTFAACYWVLDRVTPGGAFVIPGRGAPVKEPGLGDFIYLSFDTSTTFGPTIEVPVTMRAKSLMMLQVTLSIVILTVLLSRGVNALA